MPGTGRRLVDADRLKAVVDELGRAMPNDLLEANEIIRQRDSIFSLANLESQRIKNSANEYAAASRTSAEEESRARVNENEIVRQAQAQAQSIQDEAKHESQQNLEEVHKRAQHILDEAESVAASRRNGADQYAREILFNLEERISEVLGQVRKGIDALGRESVAVG